MTAMRIVDDLAELSAALDGGPGAVVTIGVYDGVHLGHHAVLRLVRELADARGLAAVCVTFDRHPAEVVRPDSAPRLLTTPEQKLELLAATGYLDLAFVLHLRRGPEPGAGRGLRARGARRARRTRGSSWSGPTSTSARGAAATSHSCSAWAPSSASRSSGSASKPRPAAPSTRRPTSASCSRRATCGAAAALLGHPLEVRGIVVEGDRRGRELGYPTANVEVPNRCCLPADGIYAGTFVGADGVERMAALSLGRRPTFYESADSSLLEAYVLDFDGDLYGQAVKVRFVQHLRGEQKFDSVGRRSSRRSDATSTRPGGCSRSEVRRARTWSAMGRSARDLRRAAARLPARRRRGCGWCRARRSRGARRARAAHASVRRVRRVVSSTRNRPTVRSTPSSC